MKFFVRLRVILTLVVAVLAPLQLDHCALMPVPASAAAIEPDHHDDGDECCPDSEPSPEPTSSADPLCCTFVSLPLGTAPVSVFIHAPTSVPMPLAVAATAPGVGYAPGAFARLEPDARSGSPPGPPGSPHSPRGPPLSA